MAAAGGEVSPSEREESALRTGDWGTRGTECGDGDGDGDRVARPGSGTVIGGGGLRGRRISSNRSEVAMVGHAGC